MTRHLSFRTTAVLVYVLLMGALVFGMFRARAWARETYVDQDARAQWEDFRADVAEQVEQRSSPVQRRIPRSVEPPALVLMRDYFGTCLVIAMVLTSALYGTFVFFLGGALLTRTP